MVLSVYSGKQNNQRFIPYNRRNMAYRVMQIMPAVDWFARYRLKEGEDEYSPLAGWAICEKGGAIAIEGFIATVEGTVVMCNESGNFAGYFHKAKLPNQPD
jgi:hypothetical protein